ncbi:3-beta hydroxysteroid dehydrogenase [Bacillus sp. HMF5848]|uniref:SDR family oxidoreductase n=1 Tax=Bacillus sp. HMF5848 TaxID=2495421 RepID=UPI000F797295|nr:SDR family oxidoreductase [Bacillus sp. HMF5848]RSK25730.1 3-beta hydroxysteroid dehydrogenase [Bacillus sp. HMF5848]
MGNTYFFTGFPGFIATSLIKQIIHDHYAIDRIYLLVLPSMLEKANASIRSIADEENIDIEAFTIVLGDITKPDLDIKPEISSTLTHSVTHVFHLAAIYDLAVPEKIANNVNVNGTKHVNDWVLLLSNLQRYVYFSTSYVAGTREGRILETELDMNQSFKNHYERTKYEAEVLVQSIVDKVPLTIIRPGIVVGHSQTGETIKFDGPYFILNFFDKLQFLPIIPYLGNGKADGNFVPIDYIFNATIYLSHAEVGIGKTYQLTDPNPYNVQDVYRMLMKEFLGKEPKGMIPLSLSKWALSIPAFRKWVRVEREAMDYFTCMAEYDCSQSQKDLEGSGISCPDFKDVIPAIVTFYKKHKHDTNKQIKIT